MDCSPPGSSAHGDFPGKNTGVGCHFLLQLYCIVSHLTPIWLWRAGLGLRRTASLFPLQIPDQREELPGLRPVPVAAAGRSPVNKTVGTTATSQGPPTVLMIARPVE